MRLSVNCQISEKFSTAVQWICENHLHIMYMLPILDDYLFIAASKHEGGQYLAGFTSLCKAIVVSLAPGKDRGASNRVDIYRN